MIIGKLGLHPRRRDRLCVLSLDGKTAVASFAFDQGRDEVAALLARGGYTLHNDDTVSMVETEAARLAVAGFTVNTDGTITSATRKESAA
jgi:hypothetical protein